MRLKQLLQAANLHLKNAERRVVILERICAQQEARVVELTSCVEQITFKPRYKTYRLPRTITRKIIK